MNENDIDLKKLYAAYHEAGHVGALLRYGFSFKQVTIISNKKHDGGVEGSSVLSLPDTCWMRGRQVINAMQRRVFCLMAGEAAIRFFYEHSDDYGCSDDEELATNLLLVSGICDAEETEKFIDSELAKATKWIGKLENNLRVSAIASHLYKDEILTKSRCKEIWKYG